MSPLRSFSAFLIAALIVAVVALSSAIAPPRRAMSPDSLSELCARDAADLSMLHSMVISPSRRPEEDPIRSDYGFDVNETFKILDRLSVEPGYKLDYVIFAEFVGSEPILYAYPVSDSPFKTFTEYKTARRISSAWNGEEEYLDHIVVQDNEAGYLQFALMRIMGDQFYLGWHALYDDLYPICTPEAIERAFPSGTFVYPMTDDQKTQSRAIDVKPVVTLTQSVVTVRLVIFTQWGGFIEHVYEFDRTFPHKERNHRETTLVEYDCGINF